MPEAEAQLAQLVPEMLGPEPRIELSQVVVEGHPSPVLENRSRDAALVVVGSRGHGTLSGMLLGSVSAHLASHALCPRLDRPRTGARGRGTASVTHVSPALDTRPP